MILKKQKIQGILNYYSSIKIFPKFLGQKQFVGISDSGMWLFDKYHGAL